MTLMTSNITVLLPHIGSASLETRLAMAELTARNVIAGLEQAELPAAVPAVAGVCPVCQ